MPQAPRFFRWRIEVMRNLYDWGLLNDRNHWVGITTQLICSWHWLAWRAATAEPSFASPAFTHQPPLSVSGVALPPPCGGTPIRKDRPDKHMVLSGVRGVNGLNPPSVRHLDLCGAILQIAATKPPAINKTNAHPRSSYAPVSVAGQAFIDNVRLYAARVLVRQPGGTSPLLSGPCPMGCRALIHPYRRAKGR